MLRIVTAAIFATTLATAACSKSDAPSCGKVVDHTADLFEMKIEGDQRTKAIAQCEKQPAKVRSCALAAKSADDLMKCK
ncbi:MAG: hypothetical protein H6709_10130 [Kofleriaceae bacterium]|nr:hypothetical protein [Kofleriaceae bacterium]MCB9572432.1 hypothetical protein [Kofleriaceae bacterium]